jgi:tetratricopeptide (TPR) repeat protein
MPHLLNLADRLLAHATTHLQAGNGSQAQALLQQLLRFDHLPAATLRTAHELLAEALEGMKRFPQARRHLHAALALAPETADLHYRLGQLYEMDEQQGDLRRALRCYRQAVALMAEDAAYQHALGRVLFLLGKKKSGLAALAKAVELAPTNVAYLREQALRLVEAGKPQAARRLVQTARFQAGNDPALAQLAEEIGFRIAHQQQSRRASAVPSRNVLPFRRLTLAARTEREEGVILRIDRPSQAKPHLPRPRRTWQTNEI